MAKRDLTPADVRKQLAIGAKQKRYSTKVALEELARIGSIEELLLSKYAYTSDGKP